MASHKLATILRSTGQLSDEEIENMSEDEAWEWLRSNTSLSEEVSDGSCSVDDTRKNGAFRILKKEFVSAGKE